MHAIVFKTPVNSAWGGGFRGSSTCPLAADGGEKCRTIYICISFLRAVVVVLVVPVII